MTRWVQWAGRLVRLETFRHIYHALLTRMWIELAADLVYRQYRRQIRRLAICQRQAPTRAPPPARGVGTPVADPIDVIAWV